MLDKLVKERLIKERSADDFYHLEPYMVKWTLGNELGLVFVVVY